ncbi:MAG: carboxypeptidase regulatory-like domain-containing protein [Bacteroidales bacterium]|nr:carboxypeptidase regulatory-like domain-containing protein [Bacteroidales bacterium]
MNNVKIEYSINNGSEWIEIIDTTPAEDESYLWEIPNITSQACLVKISDVDDESLFDVSDNSFTIWEQFTEQTSISLPGVYGCYGNSSVEWGDYDNDGDLDILIAGYTIVTGHNSGTRITKIYRNDGNNNFNDQTNINLVSVGDASLKWGDYDNDGDLDILLTGWSNNITCKIYRNNGNNSFVELTGLNLQQVYCGSADWGDYDNDGDLDFLVTGDYQSGIRVSKVFRNEGNEIFLEQSSIVLTGAGGEMNMGSSSGKWGDIDNDGDLDIIIGGNSSYNANGVCKIYRNNGDNTFSEIFSLTPALYVSSSALFDCDNDGDLDFIVSGTNSLSSGTFYTKLFKNNIEQLTFEDAGIELPGVRFSSITTGDYNNDGSLDLLLTGDAGSSFISKLFKNDENGNFVEVPNINLPGIEKGDVEWGDYDNDGNLDIILTGYSSNGPIFKIYKNNNIIHNTIPTSPLNLISSLVEDDVILNWEKSTDYQTPQDGLSYNLVIGTSPNEVDIMSPMADRLTGYRKVIAYGNAQQNTNWTIKNLDDGIYYWSVQAIDNAFAGSQFAIEQSFIIGTLPTITVTQPNGGEIWYVGSNQVIEWTSNGVENVKIEYSHNDGIDWIEIIASTSAVDGNYEWEVPNIPSEQCLIRITDVSNESVNDISDDVFTIYEQFFGILSGLVTDSNTSAPIEGALISLEGTSYEAITSADGTYEITDIEVGTYDVSITVLNYFGQTENDIIISSNNTTTLDFSLIAMPGIISGYVTESGTANPIEGANITTENADYSAVTNSDGFYIIEDVELGFYNVYATAIGYYDASVSDVEVLSNQTTTVDFDLGHPHFNFEGGNAADPVWTLYLSTAIMDELDLQADDEIGIFDGELLVGAFILPDILTPGSMFDHALNAFSTLTSGPGYTAGNPVTFKCWDESIGLEASGFTVEYSDPYGDAWIENTFPPGDGQYSIVDLDFVSGGTISGTITLNGGPGIITDVLISIGDISTNPDESGYYEFTELEPGYYDVSATLEFYHFASETVGVIAGEITIVDFTLNPMLGNIDGHITDYLSGEAIIGVDVNIGSEYLTTTNESGYYIFEGLLIGEYSLNIETQGYYPEEETNVEVLTDQTTTVNFSLHPIHFSLQPGNPIDPVWQIFLSEATLDELDLQEYDEVAVFDGDILCGQFTLTEVLIPENQYENVFIVWSTLISGEPGYTPGNIYSFKCWDASEGIEVLNYDITFHDPYGDAYTGNVFPEDDGEYSIITADFVTTITQTYDLSIGYQFVSSRVIPEDQDMKEICTDILDNLGFVRNTAGNMLRKIGPMWINGIGDWITTEGYLFKMNISDSLIIEGVEIDPQTPINLSLGYQFISFLPDNPVNALTAFNGVLDNLAFVRNSEGNMLRKIGPMWINGIGNLNPEEGYLVKMNAPDILIYPVTDEKYQGIANIKPEYFNFEGGNAAEAVFTIYVEGLNIGDEIAAFDSEKILGNVKINSQNAFDNDLPIFSIINSGNGYIHGDPINLKVWDYETQQIISPEYTLIDPYKEAYMENIYPVEDGLYSIIKFTKSDINSNRESISIFPNPSEGVFNISIAGVSGTIQVKIFDIHANDYRFFEIEGSDNIISERLNLKELPAGVYFISFSGKDFSQVKKIVIQ